MRSIEIHIHFGAHKTATTYLQNFLKLHQRELRHQGIGYIPLAKSRKIFFPAIRRMMSTWPEAQSQLLRERIQDRIKRCIRFDEIALPSVRTLILSDENFAGSLRDLMRTGELYPEITARLAAVESIFPACRFSYFFSIRDYSEYLASSYCELHRHCKPPSLENFLDGLNRETISWPGLFERLSSAAPGRKIYFWRYEDFRNSLHHIVQSLCTVPIEGVSGDVGNTVRTSLSRKGISVLRACTEILTKNEFTRLANFLVEKFEFDEDGGKFELDDRETALWFSSKYSADCGLLSATSQQIEGGVRMFRRS